MRAKSQGGLTALDAAQNLIRLYSEKLVGADRQRMLPRYVEQADAYCMATVGSRRTRPD
jgi:hypothetical protein